MSIDNLTDVLKVEGNSSLVRDSNSQAILNINDVERESYLKQRQALSRNKNKVESLEEEVKTLKNDLQDIKDLLGKLLENKNGK